MCGTASVAFLIDPCAARMTRLHPSARLASGSSLWKAFNYPVAGRVVTMSVVAHSGSEIRFSKPPSARRAAVKGVRKAPNSEEVRDTIVLNEIGIRQRPSLQAGA